MFYVTNDQSTWADYQENPTILSQIPTGYMDGWVLDKYKPRDTLFDNNVSRH